ncbi:hypothetical protein [Niabella aurantiaca]|uniref:hypothetical protein n=1 Tax=Niabella aurantiaca TaxID=379900 RepID=UPI00037DCF34|nr:hypothetical protein [Niabella aurantiaca]
MILCTVYITHRELDTLDQVKEALQLAGFEVFLIHSGRDRQLAVPEKDQDRAWEVVWEVLTRQ